MQAQVNIITTICGNGTQSYNGDNILAIDAEINQSDGITLYDLVNLYVVDGGNNRIRKIDLSTGIIFTIAGTGTMGFSGDSGLATNASLKIPEDIAIDSTGDIYVADAGNNRIRKITAATNIINTIAGTGILGYSGDNGLAISAQLNGPSGLCLDRKGSMYVADVENNTIRKINLQTNIISTIAGTGTAGYSGDNNPATSAELRNPAQVYADTFGNIIMTDLNNNAVRKVDMTTGIITTIAGNGTAGYSGDGGPAVDALLNQPYGIFIDKQNNIFVTEYGNGTIRRIDGVTKIITTVAGCGTPGYGGDGGPATDAKLIPEGVVIDDYGTMYIADYENNRIRKVYNPALAVKPLSPKGEPRVFPNPAQGNFTVEYAIGTTLKIVDVLGKEVLTVSVTSNKQQVNINSLPNGVYNIVITDPLTKERTARNLVKAQ